MTVNEQCKFSSNNDFGLLENQRTTEIRILEREPGKGILKREKEVLIEE